MNNTIQENLQKFISSIKNVTDSTFLPLVIVEENVKEPRSDFWKKLDSRLVYFSVEDDESELLIPKKINEAQKEGKRILLNIKIDLSEDSLTLFKKIAAIGVFDINGKEMQVAPGSIVVMANRDFIDHKMIYKNFYNLFSSAFSVEK